jgi:hypothetical protein
MRPVYKTIHSRHSDSCSLNIPFVPAVFDTIDRALPISRSPMNRAPAPGTQPFACSCIEEPNPAHARRIFPEVVAELSDPCLSFDLEIIAQGEADEKDEDD